jgi:8-amino-7-oxononanoate synthase
VLDLTSSLYLGVVHPSTRLPDSSSLTLGVPAALRQPPAAAELAERMARLVGAPTARLSASTLHAFFDLGAALAATHRRVRVAVDVAAYPIGRLGLGARLSGPDGRIDRVAHFDVEAARRWAERERRSGQVPVVLVDGWCPGCGRVAPIAALGAALVSEGGLLVVDDTQGIGMLGHDRGDGHPWGHGGGGSLARSGGGPGVLVVASLAKAFGAPLAVVAGPVPLVTATWQRGPTVIHSSPPPVPVLLAGVRALDLNERVGERLRSRLLSLLERLRRRLAGVGLSVESGPFPVVRVPLPSSDAAAHVVGQLERAGVRAVALGRSCQGRPALGLAVNAALRGADIDHVAAATLHALRRAA